MRYIKLFLFFFITLTLCGRAVAQNTLTLEDCIKEASQNNKDLLASVQSVKSAENSHMASIGQFLPQISFSASAGRSGQGGVNDAFNSPVYGQNSSLSLNASQDIFSGFKDFASVNQANAQLDLARAQLTQTKAQLSHDLKSAFYQLLYSQQQIDLLKNIATRQKSNMDLVEMNFKGGTDNKGSFLQAQAAYQESVYEVGQAQRALRVAQRQLAQLLGRKPLDSVEAKGDFSAPPVPEATPDFLALVSKVPAHLQAVAQLHMSESSYVTARGAFLPTLSANASLSRGGWNFDQTQPGWSAGLSLSFPLFTGGRDLFNLRSAEDSKRGAQDNLESTDLKLESQLESAFSSFQDATAQIDVQKSFVVAAKSQAEIAKAEYLNGLLIFQNWNQIETNLTSQEKSELASFLSAETAEAGWELAQGKGVIP